MKKTQKGGSFAQSKAKSDVALGALTLGEFAHQVIEGQFRRILKQEPSVLGDRDPEPLHQMRVAVRRLRTALQVFRKAIVLPKSADEKRLGNFARVLGQVRDFDVQIASLREEYQPQLNHKAQKKLVNAIDDLTEQRKKAFIKLETALKQDRYQTLKAAYQTWIKSPQYTAIAQLPVHSLLPDLLSPLVAELLLHPAWLVPVESVLQAEGGVMHDLRKAIKRVRYQTEFFIPFYGAPLENWINELKILQDQLGDFQDTEVLQQLLDQALGHSEAATEFEPLIQARRQSLLSTWQTVQHQYLDPGFRYHLHQSLLEPVLPEAKEAIAAPEEPVVEPAVVS